MAIPEVMKAAVMGGTGGPEVLRTAEVPVPRPGLGEVLIEVAYAGVGVWDAKERDGTMAAHFPDDAKRYPRVIGGNGSGRVVALGDGVAEASLGDLVYGYAYASPKGGFYAEYVSVLASQVAPLPNGVDLLHAAALAIPGGTALRGLSDVLRIGKGHRLAVFGAAGSVGLPAVQLAKAMGAQVLAVASGDNGADLARRAGADAVIDSGGDIAAAAAGFAPDGLDAVLATANGQGLAVLAAALREGGIITWPNGVQPEPAAPPGREAKGYDGQIDRDLLLRLNGLVAGRDYQIVLSDQLPLEQAAEAHRLLEQHRRGRPVLVIRG